MKYECPSCKMCWEDEVQPTYKLCMPLCVFCSGKHTQKELLNWQMDHIDQLNQSKINIVIRNFYRYVEKEMKNLAEEVYECQKRNRDKDSGKEDSR